MELPEPVDRRLDEPPRGVVALDGEDVAVFTADRTLVYRGDSLLRDASVEAYGYDIDRITASTGRRNTTFTLSYIGETEQLTVPEGRAEAVLERLLHGILETTGVLDGDEHLKGVYLFSDLTVVITDRRLVKHVGAAVWDGEGNAVPFDTVTGLGFETGAVATQLVLRVQGRAERIKVPNEEAPLLRRTLTRALCAFHGVDSLDQLGSFDPAATDPAPDSAIALDEEIRPLIGGDETGDTETGTDGPTGGESGDGAAERRATGDDREPDDDRPGERDALEKRIEELTRAVDRQNELLSEIADRLDTDR